jgi:hypothetical protein
VTDLSYSFLRRLDLFDRSVARCIHVHDLERLDVATRQLAIPDHKQISLLPSPRRPEHLSHCFRSVHHGDRNMGGRGQYKEFVRDWGHKQSLFVRGQLGLGVIWACRRGRWI